MSTEVNKEIARRWHEEVFNHRNFAAIDQFLHPNYVGHRDNTQGLTAAREGFIKLLKDTPDLHLHIDDVIAEGDKVVTRWTWQEGERVTWTGISIHRFEDGKIIEDWAHYTKAAEA